MGKVEMRRNSYFQMGNIFAIEYGSFSRLNTLCQFLFLSFEYQVVQTAKHFLISTFAMICTSFCVTYRKYNNTFEMSQMSLIDKVNICLETVHHHHQANAQRFVPSIGKTLSSFFLVIVNVQSILTQNRIFQS